MAFEQGGALPHKAEVLVAAETWGVPPWDIAGGNRVSWFLYWRMYQTKKIRAMTKAQNRNG